MATRLTDKQVLAIRVAAGKRVEVFDAQEPGLLLRVSDSGRRTWFFRYRLPDGRQPRLKLGTYPTTTIAEARSKVHSARRIVEGGGDPAGQRRADTAKARTTVVRNVNELSIAYFEACSAGLYTPKAKRKSSTTIDSEQRLYDRHVRVSFGSVVVADVTRSDIKALTRGLLARGITTQANHVHALVRQMLSYAVEEELIAINIAKSMAAPAPKKARERTLSDAEMRGLWGALEDPSDLRDEDGERVYLGQGVSIALRLVAVLLQRRIEVAGMRIDELDLPQAVWTIPATRTKNGEAQVVPLPPKAVELVRAGLGLNTRGGSPFVFPSPRSQNKPVGPDALTRAMGATMKALGFPLAGPHDLRRTGASALASERLGVAPFIVSQVLNHITDAGGGSATTKRHYNRYSYVGEKRWALEAWEGLLMQVVAQTGGVAAAAERRS